MRMTDTQKIRLSGCTPEPLMGYLKALGVFRLVGEQKDRRAKGCWENGEFVLKSRLNKETLLDFFKSEYKPTPIIVPWSGGDYFGVNIKSDSGPYTKTPTATAVIEAFLASTSKRLSDYRDAIKCALDVLQICGITTKDKMKDKLKSTYISTLRSKCGESVVMWIDTCAVISTEKTSFNALLGSGGGSDGNTHFSDNFMQNLWEALPDFNDQRTAQNQVSSEWLKNALYGTPFRGLVPERTSALYDGGAVGGTNAGQGFERISLGNPWSFILCIEGTVTLAGCISRREGISSSGSLSFPFQTRLTPTFMDSSSDKETTGREIWMPLWDKYTDIHEIRTLFSEGRSSIGRRQSSCGIDFARAVASLGIDRGISAFQRIGLVKGRIGGDKYNTSVSLGHFDVRSRPDVDLLREADEWLDRFRRAASGDNAPPRFITALRRIESSIFAFCKHGGADRFSEILRAFGNAEHELAKGNKYREDKNIRPLAGLSREWLRAANDKSPEFGLALSLAGIYDPESKLEPIRANIEPVSYGKWKKQEFCHVWNNSSLSTNLLAVLERRMMDAARLRCENLPLMSSYKTSIGAIAKYIAGDVDDHKIEELLWGMILIDHWKLPKVKPFTFHEERNRLEEQESVPIPSSYALLKLLFLPKGLKIDDSVTVIRPESAITALLRAGRIGEACSITARRLRASSITPLAYRKGEKHLFVTDWQATGVDPIRLGAALLFPISHRGLNELRQMALRPEKNHNAA